MQALRGAFRAVFEDLSPEERAARYERDLLIVTVPELWAANLGLLAKGRRILRERLAERTGRDSGDVAIRAFAEAVVGIGLGVMLDLTESPDGVPAEPLEQALCI